MMEPVQHIVHMMHRERAGGGRPVDHQYGKAEAACGDKLGLRARAPGILADDKVDAVIVQQPHVALDGERPPIDDQDVVGQRWRAVRCIDETQQIVVPGLRGKGFDMHAPKREHYPARRAGEGADGGRDVRHPLPPVAGLRRPGAPGQGQQRRAGLLRGSNGIGTHDGGKRMGGIHQMRDPLIPDVARQPFDPAETADAHRNRLYLRVGDAAGIAERGGKAARGQSRGQRARFGGAAKDQDMRDV